MPEVAAEETSSIRLPHPTSKPCLSAQSGHISHGNLKLGEN